MADLEVCTACGFAGRTHRTIILRINRGQTELHILCSRCYGHLRALLQFERGSAA